MSARTRGFTLIELLVVIAIITILAGFMVPLIGHMQRIADRTKCANNLHQLGIWLIAEAVKGSYPAGGDSPGSWSSTYSKLTGSLKTSGMGSCPAAKASSATNPTAWSTCSYGYVANLSPTYLCTGTACTPVACGAAPGKKIWKLYWSGVDYTGGHQQPDDSTFKESATMKRADNIVFNVASKDSGEPTVPTVPVHQDTDKFSTNDKTKYRTQRALREIPETLEDNQGNLPLMMDLLVLRPYPGGASIPWAHQSITEANKSLLSSNHCQTSAASKMDWGINVLFCDGSVRWKDWSAVRFQVCAKAVAADGNKNQYYYW